MWEVVLVTVGWDLFLGFGICSYWGVKYGKVSSVASQNSFFIPFPRRWRIQAKGWSVRREQSYIVVEVVLESTEVGTFIIEVQQEHEQGLVMSNLVTTLFLLIGSYVVRGFYFVDVI